MPPKHKRPSANPRDKRHENGLAAPGKQIKKRKSNGQINGSIPKDLSSQSQVPDSSVLSTNPLSNPSYSHDSKANGSPQNIHLSTPETEFWAANDQDAPPSFDGSSGLANGAPDTFDATCHPGHEYSQDRSDTSNLASPMAEPTTAIIRTHSVGDVIAILLLLLQLPASILTIVQFCFAFLTFGSPSSGWAFPSILSTQDWLQSHGGNPSVLTTITADIVFLVLWFILPVGKDVVLDLSQAVIAMSLGGGASGKSGKVHGVACLGIIATSRMSHYDSIRQRSIDILWDSLSGVSLGPFKLPEAPPLLNTTSFAAHAWPRAVLELHIITQGLVRIIRRWVSRPAETKPIVQKNHHAEKIPSSPTKSNPSYHDATNEGGRNSSTDGRPPGPPPSGRDIKEKSVPSGKKRRKQATFVRSQQPFWAAIASTKVTVSKEIEHSQASRDAFEANATDPNHLGDAMQRCFEDRVWITEILDTEIGFSAVVADVSKDQEGHPSNDSTNNEPPGFRSENEGKLMIRVNGASWSSTMSSGDGLCEGKTVAKGRILGLTPSTNYFVEFLNPEDGKLLHFVSLLTQPVASSDLAVPVIPQASQALRPSSPTTTLRTSIAATDAKLQEQRNRLKKNKRDHRSSNTSLKKEVDGLENRLSSFGGNDERQRQRRFQYRQNIRQAEDTASELASQLEGLGDIPESELLLSAESKANWQTAISRQKSLRQELEAAKTESARQTAAVRSESAALQQKRERLLARLNKLNSQRDHLVASNSQNHEHQLHLERERSYWVGLRQNQERDYLVSIQRMDDQRLEFETQSLNLEQQLHALESSYGSSSFIHGPSALPQTPESSYTGLNGGNVSRHQSGLSNATVTFQDPVGTQPAHSSRRGTVLQNLGNGNGNPAGVVGTASNSNRGRSSSMLSNVSASTNLETAGLANDDALQAAFNASSSSSAALNDVHTRHRSDGSGSTYRPVSRGNLNGGAGQRDRDRDPASPAPRLSPIGAEVGRGSPRNKKGRT